MPSSFFKEKQKCSEQARLFHVFLILDILGHTHDNAGHLGSAVCAEYVIQQHIHLWEAASAFRFCFDVFFC